jgi:hypothetical protein
MEGGAKMKYSASLAALAVLALAALACGLVEDLIGGEEPEPTPTPTLTPTASVVEPTATPQGPALRHDIPIYPGADVFIEGHPDPAMGARCATAKRRGYRTDDPVNKVDTFYQQAMPKAGWQSALHLCRGDLCRSSWFKGDASVQAAVEVGPGSDGGTVFIITRGEGCE